MTFTWEFFALSICSALATVLHCHADHLPPPTNLSYEWLDPFTVNVSWSWQKPSNLPEGCDIKYESGRKGDDKGNRRTEWRNFTDTLVTEEMGSDEWTYTICALCFGSCADWNGSTDASITIGSSKPRAKMMDDFRCVIDPKGMDCSWIPVNTSLDPKLSYRSCGTSEEFINNLKDCRQYYSSGIRRGCYLEVPGGNFQDICILVETETIESTFRTSNTSLVPLPKLNITREKHHLYLSWMTPEFKNSCWKYQFNYTQCNQPIRQQETSKGVSTHRIPYDEHCLYEIQFRVVTDESCIPIKSNWSEVVIYGANRPRDGTLTVVTIIIPIILFVAVILSCYCFRKHSNILCPTIPDPSAIFKEMMMNGNKELMTTAGSLYTPVPEPIEPCKIALVTENGVLQQTS
ncbi:interleukin-13 receptor subunit alpha-1-like isoform X2 [Trachinotus anak]|uniref:interleukin-13 receptor subunit alpha-1-like isoform X2 n=1 Tax=Trachinotus anak TaxID=443729 RepID=UPI0039F1A46A